MAPIQSILSPTANWTIVNRRNAQRRGTLRIGNAAGKNIGVLPTNRMETSVIQNRAVTSASLLNPGEVSVQVDPDVLKERNPMAARPFQVANNDRGVIGAYRPGDIAKLSRSLLETNQAAMAPTDEQKTINTAGNERLKRSFLSPEKRKNMGLSERADSMLRRSQITADSRVAAAEAGRGPNIMTRDRVLGIGADGRPIRDQEVGTVVAGRWQSAMPEIPGDQNARPMSEADAFNAMDDEDKEAVEEIDRLLATGGWLSTTPKPGTPRYKKLMQDKERLLTKYGYQPPAQSAAKPAQHPVRFKSQVEAIAAAEAEAKRPLTQDERKQIIDMWAPR